MGTVFYSTFLPSRYGIESSRHLSTTCASFAIAESQRSRPHGFPSTSWELPLAFLASLICSAYTLRYEDKNTIFPESVPQVTLPDPGNGNLSVILDPSPHLMLGACLVLGCSVSSFMYRHQEKDQYQSLIFGVIIAATILFGSTLNVSANLIMLGLTPWALCLSMIFSASIHWLVRRRSKQAVYIRMSYRASDEKGISTPV